MKYISHSGNDIIVAHFPGHSRFDFQNEFNDIKETIITKPDNISIVSVITNNYLQDDENRASVDYQLSKNNIDYINPIRNKSVLWNNTKKVKYIIEALESVNTEYSLVVDGIDVAFADNLDRLIPKLNESGKRIIYNATIWRYPQENIDYVEHRFQYGEYNYLNAGVCFGYTKDLLEFYKEVQKIIDKDIHGQYKDILEQYYVRKAFDKHQDTIFFDYNCTMFQVWHKSEYTYSEDGQICYLK